MATNSYMAILKKSLHNWIICAARDNGQRAYYAVSKETNIRKMDNYLYLFQN